jgi:hypothetical protein
MKHRFGTKNTARTETAPDRSKAGWSAKRSLPMNLSPLAARAGRFGSILLLSLWFASLSIVSAGQGALLPGVGSQEMDNI